jgi:hypothetical protein
MSRYTKKLKEDKTLVYGTDHALGYFYEIWPSSQSTQPNVPEADRCTMFGMPYSEMEEILEKYKVPAPHLDAVVERIPF